MTNRNVVRAAFVIAVALSFSIGSLRYSIGTFAHAGPGLFPLVISTIVLLLGVISLIQSRYEDPVQMTFALRGFAPQRRRFWPRRPVGKNLQAFLPRLLLARIDLAQIQHMALDHTVAAHAFVFDHTPIGVQLAILLPSARTQEHNSTRE